MAKREHSTQLSLGLHGKKKKKQWRLHNCGNTNEATALLQQFIKKKRRKNNCKKITYSNSLVRSLSLSLSLTTPPLLKGVPVTRGIVQVFFLYKCKNTPHVK